MARTSLLSQQSVGRSVGTGSNYLKSKVWTRVNVTLFTQTKPNHTHENMSGQQGLQH